MNEDLRDHRNASTGDDASGASGVSRREFVVDLSVMGAVWLAAAGCSREAAPAASASAATQTMPAEAPAPPPTLQHFGTVDAADVDAIASRIIPTDDSPGAHEAGVVYFIDNMLTTTAKDQAKFFDDGLRALTAKVTKKHGAAARFATLTAEQQDEILKQSDKEPFFGMIRFATICGFLALPKYGGNKDYVGWKFIGQEHAFEQKPPFGWYDLPENQKTLLGKVL